MFERYTERARRVVFFARYEASQFGSATIETEHLLLGLLREDKNLTNRFLGNLSSTESIRKEIQGRTTIRERVSTSIDLPLTEECKRILAYTAEEAESLNHRHIGTEHLLLGILREEDCLASEILRARGVRLDAVREVLSRTPVHQRTPSDFPSSGESLANSMVPDANTAKLIAAAIWIPAFGAESLTGKEPLQAELSKFRVWRVSSGPLFAFIRMQDGTVLAMGQKTEGTDV